MEPTRRRSILEKVAGLPSPLKGRLLMSLRSFEPEVRKAVLYGKNMKAVDPARLDLALRAARNAAKSGSELQQLNAHFAGRQAAAQIRNTTFFPHTRAKPIIQQGQQYKQQFKQLRAVEELKESAPTLPIGKLKLLAGGAGLAGLGYLAGRRSAAVPQEAPQDAAPADSWG